MTPSTQAELTKIVNYLRRRAEWWRAREEHAGIPSEPRSAMFERIARDIENGEHRRKPSHGNR